MDGHYLYRILTRITSYNVCYTKLLRFSAADKVPLIAKTKVPM